MTNSEMYELFGEIESDLSAALKRIQILMPNIETWDDWEFVQEQRDLIRQVHAKLEEVATNYREDTVNTWEEIY